MKSLNTTTLLLSTILLVTTSHAATRSFSTALGDWAVADNWTGDTLPAENDTAVVTNGREATLNSVFSPHLTTIRIGNNADGGTLSLTGGSLTGRNLQLATSTGSAGNLNMSGGSLIVTGATRISNNNGSGTNTTFSFSGGTFDWGNSFEAGSTGTFAGSISGNTGSFFGLSATLNAGATMTFTLGADGVTTFSGNEESSSLAITTGASIIVDGSAYTGSATSIPLFDGFLGGISGSFGSNVTFLGFANAPELVEGADTITLEINDIGVIPEPSLSTALVGLFMMGTLMRRRRRA